MAGYVLKSASDNGHISPAKSLELRFRPQSPGSIEVRSSLVVPRKRPVKPLPPRADDPVPPPDLGIQRTTSLWRPGDSKPIATGTSNPWDENVPLSYTVTEAELARPGDWWCSVTNDGDVSGNAGLTVSYPSDMAIRTASFDLGLLNGILGDALTSTGLDLHLQSSRGNDSYVAISEDFAETLKEFDPNNALGFGGQNKRYFQVPSGIVVDEEHIDFGVAKPTVFRAKISLNHFDLDPSMTRLAFETTAHGPVLRTRLLLKGGDISAQAYAGVPLVPVPTPIGIQVRKIDLSVAFAFTGRVIIEMDTDADWTLDLPVLGKHDLGGANGIIQDAIRDKVASVLDQAFQSKIRDALDLIIRSLLRIHDAFIVAYRTEGNRLVVDYSLKEAPPTPRTALVGNIVRDNRGALGKIDHIVVLVMENRSFDQMLGYLELAGRTDVNGLAAARKSLAVAPNVDSAGNKYDIFNFKTTEFGIDVGHDGLENGEPGHIDVQVNGGAMNGFVLSFESVLANSPPDARVQKPGDVMGYYTGTQLPTYDYIAREFAICDRWFCSVPGSTNPNRRYLVSGTSGGTRRQHGLNTSDPKNLLPIWDDRTIFEVLQERGVSWGCFYSDIPFLLQYKPIARDATYTAGIRPLAEFLDRAAKGTLPSLSWLEPNYEDFPDSKRAANDDHAPGDVSHGQALVAQLIRALMAGPAWTKTLFIITYDEHGGFYDHVNPLAPDGKPLQVMDDRADMRQYGVRVPALVVSPWVGKGVVAKDVYDHASILKTVLMRFSAEDVNSMGARVANARDLWGLLTQTTPRTDSPPPPQPATQPPKKYKGRRPDDFGRMLRTTLLGLPYGHAAPRMPTPPSPPKPGLVAEGAIVKGAATTVWLIQGGKRRWIPDWPTLVAMGYKQEQIQNVADADLNAIPLGSPLPSRADGVLLKGSGASVYVMQDTSRRWIPDWPTLVAMGYKQEQIQSVTDADLNAIPLGSPLPSLAP